MGGPSQSATFTPTNSNYSSTTANVAVTVKQASTTTALAVSGTDTYGSTQTLQATITPALSAGTVTFKDGSTTLNTCTPASGVCSINYSLAIGTHSLTAGYGANGNSAGSTSSPKSVTIGKATPTVTLTAPSTPTYGVSMPLQATVAAVGSGATPTGVVDFTDTTDGLDLGTASLSGGTATLTVSTLLTPGSKTITATYGGNASYATNNNASASDITANYCGLADTTNLTSLYDANAADAYIGTEALSVPSIDVFGINENAICAVNSGPTDTWTVTVTEPTITSEAVYNYAADANTDGVNAAVLAYGTDTTTGHGATIDITDSTGDGTGTPGSITTSLDYSNGVFASMGGTVAITHTIVNTYGASSHAFDATKAGTLTITNVTATTTGNNSAVIATGGGSGTVTVTGGAYTASGSKSSGIRAAGNSSTFNVADGTAGTTITSQNGPAVVIDGGNSVTINSAGNATSLSGALGSNQGIFLYYSSTRGGATAGPSSFSMTGGSLTYTCDASQVTSCANGVTSSDQNALATVFSVTNTTQTTAATISLTDVTVTNSTNSSNNGILLTAAQLSTGPAYVNLNLTGETVTGDVIADSASTVNMSLATDGSSVPTTWTGNIANGIYGDSTQGTVNLTIDPNSTWIVTGASVTLDTLTETDSDTVFSNIVCAENNGGCLVNIANPTAGQPSSFSPQTY